MTAQKNQGNRFYQERRQRRLSKERSQQILDAFERGQEDTMTWQELFNYLHDPRRSDEEIRAAHSGLRILSFATTRGEMLSELDHEIGLHNASDQAPWAPYTGPAPVTPTQPRTNVRAEEAARVRRVADEEEEEEETGFSRWIPWILGGLAALTILVLGTVAFWALFLRPAREVKVEVPVEVIKTVEVEKIVEKTVEVEVPGPERTVVVTETVQVEVTPQPQLGMPARTWYDWPVDRINPEESSLRDDGEINWEDLTDLQWSCLDNGEWVERTGSRDVNDNGQKLCILESVGPFGFTGRDVISKMIQVVSDQAWVIRVTPEANGTGGGWTLEAYKPGHTPSMVPGLDVPSGGHLLTITLQKGRSDYWGGFAAPKDPDGLCDSEKLVDADSGLDQWQVVCREAGATIESDGVTWWPGEMNFYDPTK